MLVRIPSIGPSIGPLMSDREAAEDALQGLGQSWDSGQTVERAMAQKEALKTAINHYLIAQAFTLVSGFGAEAIFKKSKSVAVWRLVFLGLAATFGYTTYRAFDLAKKSGAADSMVGTVAGGAAGTIQGLIGLGTLASALGEIDPSQAGKQYTLVTKVKELSRLVRTKAAV